MSGHTDWVRCISVDKQGKIAASGSSDQTVRLWDISSGTCLSVLSGHGHVVETVVFSDFSEDSPSSARFLASGSRDKTIRIWDPMTAQCLHILV